VRVENEIPPQIWFWGFQSIPLQQADCGILNRLLDHPVEGIKFARQSAVHLLDFVTVCPVFTVEDIAYSRGPADGKALETGTKVHVQYRIFCGYSPPRGVSNCALLSVDTNTGLITASRVPAVDAPGTACTATVGVVFGDAVPAGCDHLVETHEYSSDSPANTI
jgi:hypothetical protein